MSDENGPLDASSLLSMLQVGSGGENASSNDSNESNNIGSQRRSVRELLRSKAMPCAQVLEVTTRTKASLTAQILTDTHKVLLEEYATFITKPSSIEKLSSLSSSFDQIKQLVVIIRFAQLILLREPLVERNQTLPAKKCHQLVSELLQKTSQGLCRLVESSRKMKEKQDQQETTGEEIIDDEEDDNIDAWTVDASTTSDLRPVIVFAVCSFLRINSHYAKTEVALIAPIWKGICNVLTASTTSLRYCLPPEPLEEALKALSSYLVEGRDRLVLLHDGNNTTTQYANTSTAPTSSSPANTFPTLQVKLLTFLLRRVADLLKLVPNPETSSVVHSICQLFAGFRGMAPVFQLQKNRCQKMSSSHVSFEIGTKIQKIVSELAVSHPPCWIALLQKDCGYVDHHNEIIQTSPSVGLALLLQWILKKAMQSPDIKSYEKPMLRTCEYLLFQALPRCYDTLEQAQFLYASTKQQSKTNPMIGTLLHTSLQAMKNVVVRIGQNEDFLRGHRLLCRWMDQRHPLARELSVSLAFLFWMETKSIAFLSLLVKLLFDCRTKQLLRTNLSALLIRILRSNPNSQSTTEKLIKAEFLALLKSTSQTKKKRKRSTTTSNVGWAYYKYEDIQAIFNILQHGGNTSQSQSIIRTFCHKISSKGCRVRHTSAKRIALQGAILYGWLCRYGENQQHHGGIIDVQQHFQNIIGLSLRDLLRAFLRLIDNEVLTLDDCSLELAECKTILTFSLLRICGGLCNLLRDCVDAHSGSPIATSQICRILKVCTDIYMRAPFSAVSKYQRSILFEAVFFLRSLGNFIPSSCPDSALKDVQRIFFQLASSSHWPIQSYALSAMTAFGERLHKSHQSILPQFLPRRCVVLFQSRVHGFNLRKEQLRSDGKEKNGEDDCLALSTRDECRKLEVYIQPRNVGSNLFPSTAAIQIAKGSYVLKMSIGAGRDALVILPPGPQSIEDAHYRLGDERQEILSLKRCTISQNGDGECLLECQVHVVEA